MTIKFNNVQPYPIPQSAIQQSEVWGTQLSFSSNDINIISAESGKGKSTCLNIILGLRHDYSGTVTIDGYDIRSLSLDNILTLRRNHISIVPQHLQLFDYLTAYENIAIKNNIHHTYTREQILEMMEQLEVRQFEKQLISKMSYGQRQRIAIIRSLCQPFKFILLDEPFSHLDERTALLAWELIKQQAALQNAGILLTSLNDNLLKQYQHIRL